MRRALATATMAGALALVPATAPSALAADSSPLASSLAQAQEEGDDDDYGDYGLLGLLGLFGLFGYKKYKDHRAATRNDGTGGGSRRS